MAERKEVRRISMIRLLPQKTSSGTTLNALKGSKVKDFLISRMVVLRTSRLTGECEKCVCTCVETGSLIELVSHWPGAC